MKPTPTPEMIEALEVARDQIITMYRTWVVDDAMAPRRFSENSPMSTCSECERLRRELAEARAKLFPYADATEISGISFDGKYLIGDKKSISYFHEMKNRGEQIDVYARAYEQRIAAAEAKLAEARKAAFIEAAEIAEAIDAQLTIGGLPCPTGDTIGTALRAKAEETGHE